MIAASSAGHERPIWAVGVAGRQPDHRRGHRRGALRHPPDGRARGPRGGRPAVRRGSRSVSQTGGDAPVQDPEEAARCPLGRDRPAHGRAHQRAHRRCVPHPRLRADPVPAAGRGDGARPGRGGAPRAPPGPVGPPAAGAAGVAGPGGGDHGHQPGHRRCPRLARCPRRTDRSGDAGTDQLSPPEPVPDVAPGFVLGVGTLHRRKGFDVLLRALRRTPDGGSSSPGRTPARAASWRHWRRSSVWRTGLGSSAGSARPT